MVLIDVHLTFSDAYHLPKSLLTIGLWEVSIQILYIVLSFLIFLGGHTDDLLIFLRGHTDDLNLFTAFLFTNLPTC